MAESRLVDILLGGSSVERAAGPRRLSPLSGEGLDTIQSRPETMGETIGRGLEGLGVKPRRALGLGKDISMLPGPGEAASARQLGRGLASGDFGDIMLGGLGALGGTRIKPLIATSSILGQLGLKTILKRLGRGRGSAKVDVDLTFGKGQFYKGKTHKVDSPKHKFDIDPRAGGVEFGDVTQGIPLKSNSQKVVVFDPPFFVSPRKQGVEGTRLENFGLFETIPEAATMWSSGVKESARMLKPGGHLIVRIQDLKYYGPTTLHVPTRSRIPASNYIKSEAEESGLVLVDRLDTVPSNRAPVRAPGFGGSRIPSVDEVEPTSFLVFQKQ